jgi:hypothetical protein
MADAPSPRIIEPMASHALPLLLLAGAVLCACATSTPTRSRWYGRDGKPADASALRAARDRCRDRVQIATRSGPGENVEWGLAMIDCMREEGFVQVTEDSEIAH